MKLIIDWPAKNMVERPNQTPKEGEEPKEPQTPKGTEGEGTPDKKTTPEGAGLPPEGEDYKQKFQDSTRRNQELEKETIPNLERKIEELEVKLEKPSETPSEEELPEDELTEEERKARKERREIKRDVAILKEEKAWKEDFVKAKAKFPQLAEREDEFKKFCYKYPKGIDAVTLAKSFLFDEKSEPEKKVPERKGLETPTGGPSEVPKTGMSLEDIKRLREENFPIYIKMVREGKIKEIPKE